ncbi:hypothetical protein [Marinitoga lauensis]|nr:hypothetical protein [Marinitoga lauensis]
MGKKGEISNLMKQISKVEKERERNLVPL